MTTWADTKLTPFVLKVRSSINVHENTYKYGYLYYLLNILILWIEVLTGKIN